MEQGEGDEREDKKVEELKHTFFLRNWHNKKTSHISPFGSGGDREQGTSFQLSGIAQ